MHLDLNKLYVALTDDERHELDTVRDRIMRFKWLADDCHTWDEVIDALNDRIAYINDLKARGAELVQNNNDDYLFYHIPNETPIYATLTHITDTTYTFQLDDGTTLTTPTTQRFYLKDEPLGRTLILYVTPDGTIHDCLIPNAPTPPTDP